MSTGHFSDAKKQLRRNRLRANSCRPSWRMSCRYKHILHRHCTRRPPLGTSIAVTAVTATCVKNVQSSFSELGSHIEEFQYCSLNPLHGFGCRIEQKFNHVLHSRFPPASKTICTQIFSRPCDGHAHACPWFYIFTQL